MSLHAIVCAWMLDARPSGARRRLFGLLGAVAPMLANDERVTILHGAELEPFDLGPRVTWELVDIPATPTWRRVRRERAVLPCVLARLDAPTVLEWGTLPLPSTRRNQQVPVSLTIHDLRDLDGWNRRLAPAGFVRSIVQRSMRRADRVIVPSQFTAGRLRAHGLRHDDVRVIPGGVDAMPERAQPPRELFVLHVGHLEPRKNLEVLVDALERLDARVWLRLVGADHGAARRLFERAEALGVEDRVEWDEVVSDTELDDLYLRAGVVTIPSLYEGFGLPALESLARGAPTLVSDRGALPEVVGTAGDVVPAKNARAWSRAIERALTERDSRGAAGRRRAREMSWPRAAEMWLDSWRELAHRRKAVSVEQPNAGHYS